MNIDIHNAVKITADEPTRGTNSWFRTLYIYTKDGQKIEISLWTDKFNQLLIKAEE